MVENPQRKPEHRTFPDPRWEQSGLGSPFCENIKIV